MIKPIIAVILALALAECQPSSNSNAGEGLIVTVLQIKPRDPRIGDAHTDIILRLENKDNKNYDTVQLSCVSWLKSSPISEDKHHIFNVLANDTVIDQGWINVSGDRIVPRFNRKMSCHDDATLK